MSMTHASDHRTFVASSFMIAPIQLAVTAGRDPQPHRDEAIREFAALNGWHRVSLERFDASHKAWRLRNIMTAKANMFEGAMFFNDNRGGVAIVVETDADPRLFLGALAVTVGARCSIPDNATACFSNPGHRFIGALVRRGQSVSWLPEQTE